MKAFKVDMVAGNFLEHYEKFTGKNDTKLKKVISNSIREVPEDETLTPQGAIALCYKRLYETTKAELDELTLRFHTKQKMEDNREFYTMQVGAVKLIMTSPQRTALGDVVQWWHNYTNLSSFTDAKGYTHNGGEHSLTINDTKENMILLFDMMLEIAPDHMKDKVEFMVLVCLDALSDTRKTNQTHFNIFRGANHLVPSNTDELFEDFVNDKDGFIL